MIIIERNQSKSGMESKDFSKNASKENDRLLRWAWANEEKRNVPFDSGEKCVFGIFILQHLKVQINWFDFNIEGLLFSFGS